MTPCCLCARLRCLATHHRYLSCAPCRMPVLSVSYGSFKCPGNHEGVVCSGHGTCRPQDSSQNSWWKCDCWEGWGTDTDISQFKDSGCSTRTRNFTLPDCTVSLTALSVAEVCPSGPAWVDVPQTPTKAHAPAECSNRGLCHSGKCECFGGFEGSACQRGPCRLYDIL